MGLIVHCGIEPVGDFVFDVAEGLADDDLAASRIASFLSAGDRGAAAKDVDGVDESGRRGGGLDRCLDGIDDFGAEAIDL